MKKLYMLTDGRQVESFRMMDEGEVFSAGVAASNATDGEWFWRESNLEELLKEYNAKKEECGVMRDYSGNRVRYEPLP